MMIIVKKRDWRATPSVIDEIFRKSKFDPYLYSLKLLSNSDRKLLRVGSYFWATLYNVYLYYTPYETYLNGRKVGDFSKQNHHILGYHHYLPQIIFVFFPQLCLYQFTKNIVSSSNKLTLLFDHEFKKKRFLTHSTKSKQALSRLN